MKNNHIRLLLAAFAAIFVLQLTACEKETTVKVTGNCKPRLEVVEGNWLFDSLSGEYTGSRLSFSDSMRFSLDKSAYFWELNGGTIKGSRNMEGYRNESVQIQIQSMDSADGIINMKIKGYFVQTTFGQVDSMRTFFGSLNKL